MKKTITILSALLILLSLPLLSHSGNLATPQAVRNIALSTDSAALDGTVNVSTLLDSVGPPANTNSILSMLPSLPAPARPAGTAAPAFQVLNVLPGSSYITVAKSIEGTPGYNPNPCLCAPSDMGLAASSQYVFQMVNLAATVYTTS